MTQAQQPPLGHTRHTEFTLDQIAEMQPGLGMIMPQVSERFWIMYYAGHGGNWGLARYQLGELQGLLELGATTRPRHAPLISAFISDFLSPIRQAIAGEDFPTFEKAFHAANAQANRDHVDTGHPEIVWQLPSEPPKHLSLKTQTS